jgi:preprotein translocase subunit Sss1
LPVVFLAELSQIWHMAQKPYQDEWGTGAREGYEDRGAFRPPRAPQKEPGSPILRILGGIAIVGGICWGTYLVTVNGDVATALQQNRGPIAIVGLGLVASLLGKYLKG